MAKNPRQYGAVSGSSNPNYPASGHHQPAQCTMTWDSAVQAYNVNVPYHQNFIEFIKARVPGSDRAWVPSTKSWVVKENWLDVLRILAEGLWPGQVVITSRKEVEDLERQQREAQRLAILAALPERERAMFEFFEVCPLECLGAAYKRAAMLLHPDRQGGDSQKMATLNQAWDRLQKELENKQ